MKLVGLGQITELREPAVRLLGVAFDHGARQSTLAVEVLLGHAADQTEVEEADAAVVAEDVVAGVRVAER